MEFFYNFSEQVVTKIKSADRGAGFAGFRWSTIIGGRGSVSMRCATDTLPSNDFVHNPNYAQVSKLF